MPIHGARLPVSSGAAMRWNRGWGGWRTAPPRKRLVHLARWIAVRDDTLLYGRKRDHD
jgi:hypothetical protein